MSLATRCTSCATAFRVVQDQLKVSEGWVRCGRCDAVFNALQELFDLGSEEAARREGLPHAPLLAQPTAAGPYPLDAASPAVLESAAAAEPIPPVAPSTLGAAGAERAHLASIVAASPVDALAPHEAASFDELLADPIDAHLFRKRRAERETPAVQVDKRDRLEFSDARFDSDLFADPAAADDPTLVEAIPSGVGDLPLESSAQQPDFLRRAEQRARWKRGPLRAAVTGVVLLGVVALTLQVGHHFRDRLGARWPELVPVLAAWCRVAGCSLEAPRQVDALTVESTALSRSATSDGYLLAVTVRSRAAHALALPWIDLALTDGNGRLVARRALSPQDFGVPPVIQAGREVPLQLTLDTGAARIAGYTVEIFYP